MNGVIVIDKPRGIASNGVLNRLKGLLGKVKMGFLGTLDPLATGVLPVFVGKATKLIPSFEHLDKAYRVTIELGIRTDTLDAEGRCLERRGTEQLTESAVERAILAHQGELRQRAPDYSAVKHSGVAGYKLARQGKAVPVAVRTVRVWDVSIESIDLPRATFSLACSPGTYVRSLAADVGEALGVGAIVTALRRLRCGDTFLLENAVTIEEIEEAAVRKEYGFLLNPADLLADYVPYWVEEAEERDLRHGKVVPLRSSPAPIAPESKLKALRPGGTLIAVGEAVPNAQGGLGFQPTKVLV